MNEETKEEYLETLYKLTSRSENNKIKTGEIAEELRISSPSVTEVLPKLEEEGYVVYRPYHGVELTEKGKKEGKRIVRSHRILEVFLDEFFDIEDEEIHEKACELEHVFDMEMIDELCERMGAPEVCPHGKTIPECKSDRCPVGEY
ncbi:MAG: metal-dependent transcriptional regulator [Thermoplasmata archaeon]